MRKFLAAALFAALASIQGCGGGGGGSNSSAAPPATNTVGTGSSSAAAPATPAANTIAAAGQNVQPIAVNSGLGSSVDQAFTSVTLCAPGSTSCQTIDNVFVDTASSGLRIVSTALSASLALTQQMDAGGNPVVECAQFADGSTWGSVKLADLKIAGEQASSLPIQVIGDSDFPTVPRSCSRNGPLRNTVQNLHANGILGVGVFRQDCGAFCASTISGLYYVCPASGCRAVVMPVDKQVQNPVAMFAADNNGVIIELPSVAAAGAAGVSGSLVFGIGTRANNTLGTATVVALDPSTGQFTTLYNGGTYAASFVDSGSNALFFHDTGIPVCANGGAAPGFYCPAATISAAAVIQGANGASAGVNFSIANAESLLTSNPDFAAFGNLGAPEFAANTFDWGLPFFFGRNVFTAIEGANTPGGPGPYIAF